MTKKHFIALADTIKATNYLPNGVPRKPSDTTFGWGQLEVLADFLKSQNPAFNRQLWFDYIQGKCGPNGGKIK